MRWTLLLALAAGITFGHGASAQSAGREGSWETSLGIVFQNSADVDFDGGTTADIEDGTGLKLGFSYHYTDKLEFGGNISFNSIDYKANIAGDEPGEFFNAEGDLDSILLMLDATYNFLDGPFSPFVSAGIGYSWVDTNLATEPPQIGCWWDPWWGYVCTSFQDTKSIDGFAYNVGVGARYDFSGSFAVHGSYRVNWIDYGNAQGTPDFDGFELGVGWKF